MTREEEIEKEAYRQEELVNMDAESFIDGAKWADAHPILQWISVEDDLPCNHQELTHSNYTDRVLVLSRSGYFEVAFMNKIEDVWEWSTLIMILYWMPIPKIPKEQEINLCT